MKVLIISHIMPPAIDGGSRVIYKIGEYLQQQGHSLISITTDANSTDDFSKLHYNHIQQNKSLPFTIYRLPALTLFHKPFKLFSKLLPSNLLRLFSKGPLFTPFSFIKMISIVLKFRPDLIIAGPLPTTIVLYSQLFCFLSRALTFQRTRFLINASFHPTDSEFHNPILIKCLQKADYLWTLTDFETKYFHKQFHIPYSNMFCVGCGIDSFIIAPSSRVPENKRTINLLFIGSFSAHKGLNILIKAFKKLPPKYHLTVAGKSTLHRQKIPTNINQIHNFSDSCLTNILDNHDILISPSTQESFGLVLLEAMSRGLPVIASDIPASTEIIGKSKAGLTFKTGNVNDLVRQIKKISINKKMYQNFSANGIIYAQAHTWDKIVNQLCQSIC